MARCKNWEFIIYPESCDISILKEQLSELQINYYLSPLHNMDVYTSYDVQKGACEKEKEGNLKKEHYHLILCFSSMKSFAQVVEVAKDLNASLYVKEVHSLIGALRYLCHLDEKNKFHYEINDVYCRFNDYADKIELGQNQYNYIGEIYNALLNERIEEFFDLVKFFLEKNDKKMLTFCQNNSYFVVSICRSVKYRKKELDKKLASLYNSKCKPSGERKLSFDGLQNDFPPPSGIESLALEAGNEDELPF